MQWTSITVGGAALNPAVAGTGRVSFGSNAGKLLSVNTTTGAWASVPGHTLGGVQGYVSVFPLGAGESVVAADQSGWVYSVNPATGVTNWTRKLNADAVQASVSTYLREFFSSAMTAAYPGSYDVIFVATMNSTGSGGFTNNKVFALRSDTGAVLWTFSPATLNTAPCVGGCPMDQVLGQPWVDYARDRLYVTSRDGSGGTQNGIWILDVAASGALLARFSGGDFTTAPSVLFDNTKLLVGDEAGILHIVDLATLTKTTNTIASGSAFKGFMWEDFNLAGQPVLRHDGRQRMGAGQRLLGLHAVEDEAGQRGHGGPAPACQQLDVGRRLQRRPLSAEPGHGRRHQDPHRRQRHAERGAGVDRDDR